MANVKHPTEERTLTSDWSGDIFNGCFENLFFEVQSEFFCPKYDLKNLTKKTIKTICESVRSECSSCRVVTENPVIVPV